MIRTVSDQVEHRFTSHTLRRTYGRTLWKAGTPIETIQALLGHESRDTTVKYLGINQDDMSEAMEKLGQYQRALICPEIGLLET